MFYHTSNSSMDISNRMTGLCGICAPEMYRQDLRQGQGGTLTATSVPGGAKRRCGIQGQERHREEPAKRTPKRYRNTTIGREVFCPVRNITGDFQAALWLDFP